MINLRDLTLSQMEEYVVSVGQPKFRAKQVFGWIYKGKTDFREMNNLPGDFKNLLSEQCKIETVLPLKIQKSKTDGTRKYLFGLKDGNTIESVFMKYKYGNCICLSSQAGCRMGCRFCASGMDGLKRNLSSGEMISQIMTAEHDTGEKINHIVIMGTGEPFDNYENLSTFLNTVNDRNGLNIGMRNITVSTCGLVPFIKKFGDDFSQVNLAISLHSAIDKIRSSMMPINDSYSIDLLMQVCDEYTKKTRRRITFEYTMVNGVNDSNDDAEALCRLINGMLCHVNIIPLNSVKGTGFDTVSRERAWKFQKILADKGIPSTVRRELGADIDAACGQLRLGRK